MHGRVANCAKDRAGVTRARSLGAAPRNLTFTRTAAYLAVASQRAMCASHPLIRHVSKGKLSRIVLRGLPLNRPYFRPPWRNIPLARQLDRYRNEWRMTVRWRRTKRIEGGIGKGRLLPRSVYCKPTILLRGRTGGGFEVARRGMRARGNWSRDGRTRGSDEEKER